MTSGVLTQRDRCQRNLVYGLCGLDIGSTLSLRLCGASSVGASTRALLRLDVFLLSKSRYFRECSDHFAKLVVFG